MSLSGDRLNLWPSGEAKVPHAGERRHPGLFSVGQKPPGFPSGGRGRKGYRWGGTIEDVVAVETQCPDVFRDAGGLFTLGLHFAGFIW